MTRLITVVGGSGDVGAMILPALVERYEVRVADLRPPVGFSGEFVEADVTDPASMARACAGSDVVVYLAMGRKSDWGAPDWAASQFAINVGGLHTTVHAAISAGVRAFVHASTTSVFRDYETLTLPEVPDAVDAYGLSKRLGELVCEAATREAAIDIVSLRLTGPLPDEEWQRFEGPEHVAVMTAGSDVARAFVAAIDGRLEGYHALTVAGDHEGTTMDLSETRRLLGWAPLARRNGPPRPPVD